MALSAYEEQVFARLEAELRSDRERAARRTQLVACVLGAIALLLAGRVGSLALEISLLSGFSTPSIQRTCTVAGVTLLVVAVTILGHGRYRRAPG